MKKENLIRQMLEWIHPVLITALICPFFYVFYKERIDALMTKLYLTGFSLVICAAASRIAARRAVSLWTYLAVSLMSALLTLLVGMLAARQFSGVFMQQAVLIQLILGCLWMVVDAGRIRMYEKRRQKARKELDISWNETEVVMARPQLIGIAWPCVVYLAALLNHCPVLCDLALSNALLYTLVLLTHRQLETTRRYLEETGTLSNVPGEKIRTLRAGTFLVQLFLVTLAGLAALSFSNGRTYRDLRYSDYKVVITQPEAGLPTWDQERMDDLRIWFPELGEAKEPPEWVNQVMDLIFCLLLIFILCLIMLLPVNALAARAIAPTALSIERQKQFVTDAGHDLGCPGQRRTDCQGRRHTLHP